MKRFVALIAFIALLVPLAPASADLPPGGLFGGNLRIALQGAPSLNPLQFASNRLPQELAYDSLTRLGTDQEPVPWLASSWTVDASNDRISIQLRTDATWPDATAITPQDVVWSFGQYSVAGATATVAGPNSLDFTFTEGAGEFLGNAATFPIAWKSGSATTTTNGPFLFQSQDASALVLVANENHWDGRPHLDGITFLYPFTLTRNPDETTQAKDAACALMLGHVDLIGWHVTPNDLTTERDCTAGFGGWARNGCPPCYSAVNRTLLNPNATLTVPHVGIAENPGLTFLYMGINTQRAQLSDWRLRQALSRAIDRDLIAGTFGNAIEAKTDIADTPISPANARWFNGSVPKYRVERIVVAGDDVVTLEKVAAFLDQSGYLDRDSDSWRDDPSGNPFSFTLLVFDSVTDPRGAKYDNILLNFQNLGLNVTLELLPPATIRSRVATDAFDMFIDLLEVRSEPAFLFDLFHSTGSGNVVNIDDPTLDALLERARDTFDPADRHRAVDETQGWVVDNVPLAPIIHYRSLHVYNRTAYDGWGGGLGGLLTFHSLTSVHVTQFGPLTVQVDALQPSLDSLETTDVVVRVRDAAENPVPGALVELQGTGLAQTSGTTDIQGTFVSEFTAPEVGQTRDYEITVEAAKLGYGTVDGTTTITVHPVVREFVVSVTKGSASIGSGGSTTIRVTVIDATTASPAIGATVTLSFTPIGLGGQLGAASGVTNSAGTFETTFTASVSVVTRFLITATVTQSGFEDGRSTTSIEVSPGPAQVPSSVGYIALGAAVAALGVFGLAWWRGWLPWIRRKE